MKRISIKLVLATCMLAIWGCLHVNAQELLTYGNWTAKYYYGSNDNPPSDDWYKESFDDSDWGTVQGPLYASTPQTWGNACGYWLRRHFTVENIEKVKYACFYYYVDDAMQVFLNGHEILNLGIASSKQTVMLADSVVKMIKQGDNVLAVRAYDTGGGDKFADFGLTAYEDIYQSIITTNDVPVTFIGDSDYPWSVNGSTATSGNKGLSYSKSSMTFSYSSQYKTQLAFNWWNNNHDYHSLLLFVDGVNTATNTSSSSEYKRFFLPEGDHIIEFRDTIWNGVSSLNQTSCVSNISLKEIRPIEDVVLSPKSQPLTFINNGTWPWTTEDGYIQSSNYNNSNTVSKFSTSFTITEPSRFSFWSSTYFYYSDTDSRDWNGYQYFDFKINGKRYMGRENGSGTTSVFLEPGEYTMEWSDSIYNNTNYVKSKVSNIELSSNWVNIDVASNAGTLGVEVLCKVNVLADVELLKVSGTINSTDWATIKQMTNLIGLDLTDAKFDAVPNYAFDGLSKLLSVKLPEGCKSIGQYAFRGTQILNIDIPSSVTLIDAYCFENTRVRTVNFKDNSNLKFIGYRAFYKCTSLEEFDMPNTVTYISPYNGNYTDQECSTFSECYSLKKIHFSDALTTLEQYVCYNCYNLTEVHLPANLVSIRDYAFYNTSSLRKLDLPKSLNSIDYQAFYNCGIDSLLLPVTLSTLEDRAFSTCQKLKYIDRYRRLGRPSNSLKLV